MGCITCAKNRERKRNLLRKKIETIETRLKDQMLAPAEFQEMQRQLCRIRAELNKIKY